MRQEKSLPLLAAFKTWLEANVSRVLKGSLTRMAMEYTLNQWEYLIGYCERGDLKISNALAENAIRHLRLASAHGYLPTPPKAQTPAPPAIPFRNGQGQSTGTLSLHPSPAHAYCRGGYGGKTGSIAALERGAGSGLPSQCGWRKWVDLWTLTLNELCAWSYFVLPNACITGFSVVELVAIKFAQRIATSAT